MIANNLLLDGCEICGSNRNLDRHHIELKGMGGTSNPAILSDANLITLCRDCHRKIHDAVWSLSRSAEGIRVVDPATGEQVMRRRANPDVDVPGLLQLLNLAEASYSQLFVAIPYFTDEQLGRPTVTPAPWASGPGWYKQPSYTRPSSAASTENVP